ncbi:hypothetical protein, partial [Leeuwenhoekiella nanhaiensis]|uniref:hypothetical protein n=1 Tax=Leeuwenhoekiella nanhaiensis TaxID=1655491 RepID=UPI001CB8BF7C
GPITVPTVDDTAFEEDETFTVVVTVTNGTVANSPVEATGTISMKTERTPIHQTTALSVRTASPMKCVTVVAHELAIRPM